METTYYQGNRNLNKSGIEHEYTEYQIKEIIKCKNDPIYFIRNYIHIINLDEGLVLFKLYDYQEKIVNTIHNEKRIIGKLPRQTGKALDIETDILTIDGFQKLKDICVGDTIFGKDGKPTKVTFITDTMYNHDCYRLTFSSGDTIVADAGHLWEISNRDWQLNKHKSKYKIFTTKQILEYLNTKSSEIFIETTQAVNFPTNKNVFDPYTFGLWLGDGNSDSARISCHKDDYLYYKEKCFNVSNSFYADKRNECVHFKIDDLYSYIRINHIKNNKHIPQEYFKSSIEQRKELLRGLMDSDGYPSPTGCEFYQKKEHLIDEFRILLSSLGVRSQKREKFIKGKKYFTVSFSPEFEVFNIPRKRENQIVCSHKRNKRLYISKIEKVESVPVKCLQVDNEDHMFLAGKNLIPTHNTTTVASYMTHYAIFNENKMAAILANKSSTAREILHRVKTMIENLPSWLKPGIVEWNKGSIEFENGSKILTSATSSSAIRGLSCNFMLLDEFAFIGAGVFEDFIQSVYPTVSSSKEAKIIMVSTPWGLNHFYKFWKEALDGKNGYVPIEIKWNDVPGRDDEWRAKIIDEIGEERFNQEMAGEFIGSSNTLIDTGVLRNMVYEDPISIQYFEKFHIFEKPQKNNKYVLICDVAEGVGGDGDSSTVQVIDVSEIPYKQVARYEDNTIKPNLFSTVINNIGLTYNKGLVIVENNTIGMEVLNNLNYNEEYPEIFFHNKKFGLRMTKGSKRVGCGHMKNHIEKGILEIKDFTTIQQLTVFEKKKNGTYSAEENSHDDLITPLILFSYFMSQDLLVDLWLEKEDVMSDIYSRTLEEIEENLLPVGFLPDNYYDEEEI